MTPGLRLGIVNGMNARLKETSLRQHRGDAGRDDEGMKKIDADAFVDESIEETQSILNVLRGKTVGLVVAEERRIVIETTDGSRFYFSGMAVA